MNISGIYQIINKATGDYYLGSSIDIPKRWSAHRNSMRRDANECRILQNAWNKYGEDSFEFKVIGTCPVDKLVDLETYMLNDLHPAYNIALDASAPMRGRTHTEEHKKKIGRSGKTNPFYGRKHTTESLEKMRLAKVGKKASDATKAKQSLARRGKPKPESFRAKVAERMKGNTYGRASKGTKRSVETRLKISRARIGIQSRLGAVLSEETKQKISISLKEYYKRNPPGAAR